jgi:V/A-type H+-transporting ATPase subunit E|tara:strand:- start:1565 stop:2143 length:579 start_codon:yes stop_codon:yes gene_type:complete
MNKMTLEALASEIAIAAKKEAKGITDAAKTEAKGILKEAKDEANSYSEDINARAERESAQIETETVASARQANQKEQLIARREELDTTWDAIREQVGSSSMKGRAGLIKILLAQAKGEADSDMILCPVGIDRPALEKASSGFDFGNDVDGLGGFVLETQDGSVVLDYRFDGRLEESWDSNLSNVTSILFGDA